jgi:SAM-dependent methyltransferase
MPLQPMRDGFGQEIWAHHQTGHGSEIVERDDGYIDATPTTTGYFAPFRRWPTRQKRAMRLIRGKRALDVGCGAGRVALYLQEKRLRVTAIDNSPLAIQVCRSRGVKHAVLMSLDHIGRLRLRSRFDTVIMFGNNFGLFGSRAKARTLLRKLHRLTSSGAVILAESINPYQTHNPFHLKYQARNRRRGRMSGQLRIRIRFQAYATAWFEYLFVSPEEMRDIVQGTGWKLMRVIEDGSVAYIGVLEKE